jgi:hypothetical protein
MKQIEKLVLVVIAFLIFSRVGIFIKDIFYAYSVGTGEPTLQQTLTFKNISFILFIIVNIGSSIWLYVESQKAKLRKWIWTLFGLLFGLMAVAIFYLSGIYHQIRSVEGHRRE